MERKKKCHVGRTIFLILLLLILLAVGGTYLYLTMDHFDIDARYEAARPTETYQGTTVYAGDSAEIALTESEINWLIQEHELLEELDFSQIVLEGYAIDLNSDGITFDARLKAFDLLPVPLSVQTDFVNPRGGVFELTVQQIHLGKWIEIPLSVLDRFGVEKTFSVDLADYDDGLGFRSAKLQDGAIRLTVDLGKKYVQWIKADPMAEILLLYGEAPTEYLTLAAEANHIESALDLIDFLYERVFAADDPVETVTQLLALSAEGAEKKYLSELTTFEHRYLLPISAERVQSLHQEYLVPIAQQNRAYEQLLNALREKYKNLEIQLRKTDYYDLTQDAPLSISALAPELGLDEASCRALLLTSIEPRKYPLAAEMPTFRDVPKQKGLKLKDATNLVKYDIGLIIPMETGAYAMVYYLSTGELVIHCLPEGETESTLKQFAAPQLMNLDSAVYGARWVTNGAPAEGLKPYIVFTPYAVDFVYKWYS